MTPEATLLWLLAIGFYGVGDLVTTAVGIRLGLAEGQPFVQRILGESPTLWRFALFGAFKAGLLGGFYLGYVALEGVRYRVVVPAGIAVIGLYVVYRNGRAILGVVNR
ncbi:hypothetical protein [Natronobacterium texcoconense]|uniref:DUF5658 domain-containing protein n=1 Tax=Natronobacterium texcoconense TaxID=1095778 RepID=A0A1H1GUE0_NATTX|nr:hypothetical protein [Natronobacterium texcoconense]SDR16476.1 hypothetical protein SAMN04489842_2601 [Natronobacterium texcoconense]